MNVKRWNRVGEQIKRGEFDAAVADLEKELAATGHAEFQPLIEQDFTEPPSEALGFLNELIAEWKQAGPLGALYLEMNGYDINTDEWYFDAFGYAKDGGAEGAADWLCDWAHDSGEDTWVLEGMEKCQAFFEWYHNEEKYEEKKYNEAYDMGVLLVMTKYVRYIGRVLASGPLAEALPVYATAHEFDIIARFPAGK